MTSIKSATAMLFAFIFAALISTQGQTEPLMTRAVGGASLYKKILESGVSENALRRAFEFIDVTSNKNFEITVDKVRQVLAIKNSQYLTIVDFTKPSSQQRLYLIDLNSGIVEKYYVAHGENSGNDLPTAFSNILDSKQSSLGLYLTGDTYVGKHGTSLRLYGLEKSNSLAYSREIVVHGADYVSLDFLSSNGRMGRSWGCPAVSVSIAQMLIPKIKGGSVLYVHHDSLMAEAQTNPTKQTLIPIRPGPTKPPVIATAPITQPVKPAVPASTTSSSSTSSSTTSTTTSTTMPPSVPDVPAGNAPATPLENKINGAY